MLEKNVHLLLIFQLFNTCFCSAQRYWTIYIHTPIRCYLWCLTLSRITFVFETISFHEVFRNNKGKWHLAAMFHPFHVPNTLNVCVWNACLLVFTSLSQLKSTIYTSNVILCLAFVCVVCLFMGTKNPKEKIWTVHLSIKCITESACSTSKHYTRTIDEQPKMDYVIPT